MDPTQWDLPFPLVVGALFCIVMARANGTYWMGRLVTRGAASTRARVLLESPGYQRATERLHRWGAPVVTLSFLTVGVQTMVNIAAGATRMPLRRYLRRELGLPKAQVDAHGYWKRGTAGHDHHAPIDETDPDD